MWLVLTKGNAVPDKLTQSLFEKEHSFCKRRQERLPRELRQFCSSRISRAEPRHSVVVGLAQARRRRGGWSAAPSLAQAPPVTTRLVRGPPSPGGPDPVDSRAWQQRPRPSASPTSACRIFPTPPATPTETASRGSCAAVTTTPLPTPSTPSR